MTFETLISIIFFNESHFIAPTTSSAQGVQNGSAANNQQEIAREIQENPLDHELLLNPINNGNSIFLYVLSGMAFSFYLRMINVSYISRYT